ncbi:MAG: NAD(P)-dependent oxidoreductase [Candidatus Omnitrophica bacterium]|jgi:GDP-L-fucose synthase|nr:NAD(P)-dependent oxidoreductase [Candidatus Omnitrophota bacterium]
MKIFLTGASGFIGRNIKESFLASKYKLVCPTHAQLDLLDQDSVDAFFRRHKYFDAVIHAAVRPGHRNAKDPSGELYHNTRMFFNLVRHKDSYGKIIVLSSGLVYDQRYYLPKMKEDYFGAHIPTDEGGLSKYIIAKYVEKMTNAVELRVFGIFGKYEDYAIRFISNAICKAVCVKAVTIKQNRKFDYIFVDDFMPILDYFINHKAKYKAYNITPYKSIELRELAKKVIRVSGKKLPIKIAKPGIDKEYSGDNKRITEEIKDISFTSIDKAISMLYDWYLSHCCNINNKALCFDK